MRRIVIAAALMACLFALPASAVGSVAPEARLIERLNEIRADHGLPPLLRSESLSHSSHSYARTMMRTDRFGHGARISASGRFRIVGETLEWHSGWDLRPVHALRSWMGSPPHRALLLSRNFSRIGVGRARGLFAGGLATMWVAHLGRL